MSTTLLKIASKADIVYVLTNIAMPEYIKIGKTNNIKKRIQDLSSTSGMPFPFELHFAARVEDADYVEKRLHHVYARFRARLQREFFKMSPDIAMDAIKIFEHEEVLLRDEELNSPEVIDALNIERERKSAFNFFLVDILPGEILEFTKNPEITCTVIDQKNVRFENEVMSLTAAAKRALGLQRPVQGPLFWKYQGENLVTRRARMEK